MQPAIDTPSSYTNRSPGSRLVAALAALVITALIILVLLELGLVTPEAPPTGTAAVMLNLLPGKKSPQATKAPAKAKSEPHKAEPRQTKASAAPRPVVQPPPTAAKAAPWNVIYMTHDQMVAADIGNMPSHHPAAEAASGEASADGGGDAGGNNGAPGPDRLFRADWYRQPTDAELAAYIPKQNFSPGSGYGEIACRTAPRYRVEDCKELDSQPPGSGFGRAVLDAAWQFLVMPPRVNGRPMVGAWVRIRITYTASGQLRGE